MVRVLAEMCVFAVEIIWVKRAWQGTQVTRKTTVSPNTIFAVFCKGSFEEFSSPQIYNKSFTQDVARSSWNRTRSHMGNFK